MGRRLRVHLPGGIYHVTLRGNHARPIFHHPQDRRLLEKIVIRALENFACRLHAYCWMTNHLHLVLQAAADPISRPMHNIAAEFARAMQLKLETTGHFFERRFHATLVDSDSYMLELLRYVHLNPVEARICASVDDYRWSSHHNYTGRRIDPWVTTDFALGILSADRARAMERYRAFIGIAQDVVWQPSMAMAKGAAVMGNAEFVARVTKQLRPVVTRQSLADLINEAIARFEISREILFSPLRDRYAVQVRAWIAYQAGQRGIATLAAVARELGRTEGALRSAVRAYPGEVE